MSRGDRRRAPVADNGRPMAPSPSAPAASEAPSPLQREDEERFDRARALHRAGRLGEARALYQALQARHPRSVPLANLLGQLHFQEAAFDEAWRQFEASLALEPAQPDILVHAAAALRRLQRPDEALALLDRAIVLAPRHAGAHNNRGLLLHETLRRPQAALACFEAALQADPRHAGALFNWGNALRVLGRLDEAITRYDAALALQPAFAEALNNRGVALRRLGRLREALDSFTRLAALQPRRADAQVQLAQLLQALGRDDDALAAYERALALDPQRPDAWTDRSVALKALGRPADALHSIDQAIARAPGQADLHANRGNTLRELGRFDEALASYDTALALSPGHGRALELALLTQLELCDWSQLAERCTRLAAQVREDRYAGSPFVLLALFDNPALQRRAAQAWSARLAVRPAPPLPQAREAAGGRLRIGYFSSDFGDHPVSHLLAAVLEAHDRQQVEVLAFGLGPRRDDPWRRRVVQAVDRFVDLGPLADDEAIAAVRAQRLDVAIDLNGCTRGQRLGLFAARCAPVQASYLGYPGTLGAPFIDYLVTDAAMASPTTRPHLAERLITLPCFQCNDVLAPAGLPIDRVQVGLPAEGFVFASFNSNHKLTPAVFAGWLRVLGQVPGSVLWIYLDRASALPRLRAAAEAAGIDPHRLVPAARVPLAEHRARLALADLFLDTFPYNAGATASDALRAGVPVLTRRGESLASRMGASLLHAVGLPELVTASVADYEAAAVALATDPARLQALRARLAAALPASRLFDPRRFARSFEAACAAAHRHHAAGLAPADLVIDGQD